MKNLFQIIPALAMLFLVSCTDSADNTAVIDLEASPKVMKVANTSPGLTNPITDPKSEAALTTVAYAEETYDFGKMKVTDKFTHKFILTNTGTEALNITEVKPSCSCTASDWTKSPIQPGETGYVLAEFKPKPDYTGFFTKTVTVKTNTEPNVKVLKFTGEIVN